MGTLRRLASVEAAATPWSFLSLVAAPHGASRPSSRSATRRRIADAERRRGLAFEWEVDKVPHQPQARNVACDIPVRRRLRGLKVPIRALRAARLAAPRLPRVPGSQRQLSAMGQSAGS